MALQEREKKLLPIGAGALILTLAITFWPSSEDAPKVVSMSDTPEVAETRLTKTMQLAAQVLTGASPAGQQAFAQQQYVQQAYAEQNYQNSAAAQYGYQPQLIGPGNGSVTYFNNPSPQPSVPTDVDANKRYDIISQSSSLARGYSQNIYR